MVPWGVLRGQAEGRDCFLHVLACNKKTSRLRRGRGSSMGFARRKHSVRTSRPSSARQKRAVSTQRLPHLLENLESRLLLSTVTNITWHGKTQKVVQGQYIVQSASSAATLGTTLAGAGLHVGAV